MSKTSKEKPYKGTRKDQYTIVLEGIRSDFRTFGDGLLDIRREIVDIKENAIRLEHKVDRLEDKVDIISMDVVEIKKTLRIHHDELQNHEDRITILENS